MQPSQPERLRALRLARYACQHRQHGRPCLLPTSHVAYRDGAVIALCPTGH